MYICKYKPTYVYTDAYVYKLICKCLYIHACIYMYIYIYICECVLCTI